MLVLKNFLDKVYCTITYDPLNKWYYADWIGYVSPENIKTGAMAYLDLMKENPSAFLLNNNQNLVGPWDKANDWLENIWVPEARAHGLRYMAHVLAPNIAAALSGQDLHRRVDSVFDMRIFGDMAKAQAWLRQVRDTTAELV